MSILFDDASSQYGSIASVPSLSLPFAIACWLYIDDLWEDQTLVAYNDASSENNYYSLEIKGKKAQITEVTTLADRPGSDSLESEYFLIDSPNDQYYVWFSIDSSSIDPAPLGLTGIEVAITAGDSANNVASALQLVMDAELDFAASVIGNVVTISCVDAGVVNDAADFDTGFGIVTTQQGTVDDAFIRGKLVDNSGVSEIADSAIGINVNTWHHALVIFNAVDDIRVYLDGNNEGLSPGGAAIAPTGVDTISIGRLSKATPTQYISGRLAEISSWNLSSVLTSAERNDIAIDKQSALLVRSDELIYHAPMYDADNPIIDIVGRRNAVLYNTPITANHPPIQNFEPETYQRFRSGPIEFARDVLSAIGFTHQANWELERSVSSSISFNQDVHSNVKVLDVQSNIQLEGVLLKNQTLNISIEHNLSLTQTFGPTTEESVSSSITFTQEVARGEDPSNDIYFEGVVSAEASTTAENEVEFDHEVAIEQQVTKVLASDILFGQAVVAILEEPCDRHEYSPQGSGMPNIVFGVLDEITLTYMSGSITLRNPDFGNIESLDVDRALNISRGGTPKLMRDSQWPKITTHTIVISVMNRTKAQELLTFLKNSLGLLVTYTDPEDRDWEGIITNPDSALTESGDCKYSATLIIESNLV